MLANSLRDQWGISLLEAGALFASNKNDWIEDLGERRGRWWVRMWRERQYNLIY